MKKFYNKLVRDNIPEIIKKDNRYSLTRSLDDISFEYFLNKKIKEEALELSCAENREEIINELADLFEVILIKAELNDISFFDIEDARIEKRSRNGGFDDKKLLIYTVDQKYVDNDRNCASCINKNCDLKKDYDPMLLDLCGINCDSYVSCYKDGRVLLFNK